MFKDELRTRNMFWLSQFQPYRNLEMNGLDTKFYETIIDIIKKKLRVLVYPDPDVDGMISAHEIQLMFGILNYQVDVYRMQIRKHGITRDLMQQVIAGYDVVIIVDSSTNSIAQLNRLASYGKKVIVLDHHIPEHNLSEYNENVLILNTKMINPDWKMSAGAFIAMLCIKFLNLNKLEEESRQFYLLGSATLYSDSCEIDKLNLSLIQTALRFKGMTTCKLLNSLMNEWSDYGRNFLVFQFNNRVNACLRSGRFDLINQMFFDGFTDKEEIELVYKAEKLHVEKCLGTLEKLSYDKIEFIDLNSTKEKFENIVNYTGLIGNNVASTTNKLVVCIATDLQGNIKGSVRDAQQRNILEVFQTFVKAGGHASAFGFYSHLYELDVLRDSVIILDRILQTRANQNIIMTQVEESDLLIMADFNEVNSMVRALIRIRLTPDMKIYSYKKAIHIKWGSVLIKSFKPIQVGNVIYVEPSWSNNKTQFLVSAIENSPVSVRVPTEVNMTNNFER